MSKEKAAEKKGTCFVVMGFGKKMDFETKRTLDLDKTYNQIIKPAVEDAGL
ncbi:MAG: tetratricopeptide repeat protein, partial [Pyrinomonadaceae bacterium]